MLIEIKVAAMTQSQGMCGKGEGQRRREEEGRKELVNRPLKTLIEMFYMIQWQFSVSIKKELDQQ